MRTARPLRRIGRARARLAVRRRPPRRQPPAPRRALVVLLLAIIVLLLALLLRREPQPSPPPPSPAAAAPIPPPPPRRAPPPAPRQAFPSPRERLLAAIRDRAGDLAACEAPPGSPTRVPTRLGISRAGVPRTVAFEGAPAPPPLAACMRERILAWRFDGLALPSDVEVLVTFSVAPAHGAAAP